MYGKTLSIPDNLIYTYFELVTDVTMAELPAIKEKAESNPRNAKHELAFTVVRMYHGEEKAKEARQHFEQTVINKQVPDDAPVFEIKQGESYRLLDIISELSFSPSNGETKRLMKQGGVSVDDGKIEDIGFILTLNSGEERVLKVGKRKFAVLKGI